MRQPVIILIPAILVLLTGNLLAAQYLPPDITATAAYTDIPIGQAVHIDYVTPRHHNGKILYTLMSPFPGQIPIGFGYCLPLAHPVTLMGYSLVAANKASFHFSVPMDPGFV